MKKTYLILPILLLMTLQVFSQKSRVDSVLFHETFETSSTTLSNWTTEIASNCSAYNWSYITNNGKGALGSNRYAVYPSASATKGCYSSAYTPVIQQPKQIDNNDSVIVDFYTQRYSTSATDYISVEVFDASKTSIWGPFNAFADINKSPVATGTGWYHFVWKMNYNDILNNNTTTGFFIGFTGVSAHGVDLSLDEVSISHISHQIIKKLQFSPGYKGDTVLAKTQSNIQWTSQNINSVDIGFSDDNGKSYQFLSTVSASTGSYLWTVPNEFINTAFLKLTDHDSTDFSVIKGPFSIQIHDGISKVADQISFSIYPNPAHSSISLRFPDMLADNTSAKLFDINGKLLISKTLPDGISETSLDIANLSKGVYILDISNAKSTNKKEIIVN